jgi:hypothetical protein
MRLFSTLKTGDVVPASGVYRALHSTPHTLIQHEVCFEENRFKGCRMCPLGVFYRLESRSIPEPLTATRHERLLA